MECLKLQKILYELRGLREEMGEKAQEENNTQAEEAAIIITAAIEDLQEVIDVV